MDMSSALQRVLEDAHEFVGPRGGPPVDTVHLLLALPSAPDEEPAQIVLHRLGVAPSAIRAATDQLLEPS